MAATTSMKSLAVPLLIVAVVLIAFAGVAGGAGWFRGWHGWQSLGMHGGMHGMMMGPRRRGRVGRGHAESGGVTAAGASVGAVDPGIAAGSPAKSRALQIGFSFGP
jgi:hypothetical protein